jgi:hypothetical protein
VADEDAWVAPTRWWFEVRDAAYLERRGTGGRWRGSTRRSPARHGAKPPILTVLIVVVGDSA